MTPVLAYQNISDPLIVYRKRLSELNNIFNTQYTLPSDDDVSYEKMVNFYLKMSISQFDDYIRSLHQVDMKSKREMSNSIQSEITIENNLTDKEVFGDGTSGITTYAAQESGIKRHRLYYRPVYGGKDNFLFARFYVGKNSKGKKAYTGLEKTGSKIYSYPAYKNIKKDFVYVFTNNNRKVICGFLCHRYISQYVMDATIYKITCTFAINGGHIHADTYA
jgi:hypothetical protein